MGIKQKILEIPFVKNWKRNQEKKKFQGSELYWEERYQKAGNSGSGSYDHLADYKAEVINDFVAKHAIKTVMEFGCGDGNQLLVAKYPHYIGLDVSPTAVKMCYDRFKTDNTKSFYVYNSMAFFDRARIFHSDLTMSLDVLYHLVEKEIFENYLRHLFAAADKYVIIYASDYNQKEEPIYQHENRRNFTDFIKKNIPGWNLKEIIKNKYPVEQYGEKGSLSDFFIYEKTAA
jgi:cyclopropane fatty-acyl-phospholipid synthase-like methyltransferase